MAQRRIGAQLDLRQLPIGQGPAGGEEIRGEKKTRNLGLPKIDLRSLRKEGKKVQGDNRGAHGGASGKGDWFGSRAIRPRRERDTTI